MDTEGALHRIQLETLYRVSVILSRTLDVKQAPQEVLRVLEESAGSTRGMIAACSIPIAGELVVNARC